MIGLFPTCTSLFVFLNYYLSYIFLFVITEGCWLWFYGYLLVNVNQLDKHRSETTSLTNSKCYVLLKNLYLCYLSFLPVFLLQVTLQYFQNTSPATAADFCSEYSRFNHKHLQKFYDILPCEDCRDSWLVTDYSRCKSLHHLLHNGYR